MTTQNFYGPVDQVAGRDAHASHSPQAIEARRQELYQRAKRHVAQRDSAERRIYINGWNAAMLILLAVLAWCVWYMWPSDFALLQASVNQWIVPIAAIMVAMMVVAFGLDRLRKRCRIEWRHHNDAIRDINRMLNTL